MNKSQEARFSLEDILVTPAHNKLNQNDICINLQPKAMAVLQYLALNHHRVIDNEELIEQVWEGRVVTHGSVQKSINMLRKAFSELLPDREVITHYSKRGYQLNISPEFDVPEPTGSFVAQERIAKNKLMKIGIALAVLLVGAALMFYVIQYSSDISVKKRHVTEFSDFSSFTSNIGQEFNAEPHPNNRYVAYAYNSELGRPVGVSDIELRVGTGDEDDWIVASSSNSWHKMVWSPSGDKLLALEMKPQVNQQITPDFFQPEGHFYTFHIFHLNLEKRKLNKKFLLSHWQGLVSSIAWRDEDTLEFVAAMGSSTTKQRFRYAPENKTLTLVEDEHSTKNIYHSTIHNNLTALLSTKNNGSRVSFIGEDSTRISAVAIADRLDEISWIPDGSGVIGLSVAKGKLWFVYLDGKTKVLEAPKSPDKLFFHPRFGPDGKKLYYTETSLSDSILAFPFTNIEAKVVDNANLNYSASYSRSGEKFVYASVRSEKIQLWAREFNKEKRLNRLPLNTSISDIAWAMDDSHILYKSGDAIFIYDFVDAKDKVLYKGANNPSPIYLDKQTKHLYVIKTENDVRNIWGIGLGSAQKIHQQLTFGSVGTAMAFHKNIYFQYLDSAGLWVFDVNTGKLNKLNGSLQENSKILWIDGSGIYFVTGGRCRESDVYRFDMSTQEVSVAQKRKHASIITNSFHPAMGSLYTECNVRESNILILE